MNENSDGNAELPLLESVDVFRRRYDGSRTLTYKLIAEGKIRVVKLGRRTLIDVHESLKRIIAEGSA